MNILNVFKKKDSPIKKVNNGDEEGRSILDQRDVLNPTKGMRKLLGKDWVKLSAEEKMLLRAKRAKMGIKCPICGQPGYFRETCVNGCQSPPGTPDSTETPPPTPPKDPLGLGVLWNMPDEVGEEEQIDTKTKVNLDLLRPAMNEEKIRLRASDEPVGIYEFFTAADEGYSRNLPELTLHQTMRRLMRLTERSILKNVKKLESSYDVTLLHPPTEKETEKYYPEELGKIPEYQDYFYKQIAKLDRKKVYMFKGGVRPSDALDPIFRGGSLGDNSLYTADKEAGTSIHAKIGWKSNLARHDQLAVSDPKMIHKAREIKELFAKQGEWARLQKKNMQFRNDMFEHLVEVLRIEMSLEHKREASMLEADTAPEIRQRNIKIWQDRLSSVDRIIQTVVAYKLTSALDEADYLVYCLERWREVSTKKLQQLGVGAVVDEDGIGARPTSKSNKKKKKKKAMSSFAMEGVSPYEVQANAIESKLKKRKPYTRPRSAKLVTTTATDSYVSGDDDSLVSSTRMKFNESLGSTSVSSLVTESILKAKSDSDKYFNEIRIAEEKQKEKDKWKKRFAIEYKKSHEEIEAEESEQAKKYYEAAELGSHIRQGNSEDVAYLAPTLIPVPNAFKGDGKTVSISHVANQTIDGLQDKMVDKLSGRVPHKMLPLYVRSTLLEKNGTKIGGDGDQPVEIMNMDRRYSHYIGRSLNRFEPGKRVTSLDFDQFGRKIKLAPVVVKRKKKADPGAVTTSLVRLAFGKEPKSLMDLRFEND